MLYPFKYTSMSHSVLFYAVFLMVTWLAPMNSAQAQSPLIYDSPSLKVRPLTDHTYQHITFIQTEKWGAVGCNGVIYVNKGKAIVFDTPTSDSVSLELINFIRNDLKASIQGVVVNHFHEDCLGGLQAFHDAKVPSYSNKRTHPLAEEDHSPSPTRFFKKELTFKVEGESIILYYPGRAHSPDNIVGYIPSEKVLFGGCMIKSLGSGKGNLSDASVAEWTTTVASVERRFPKAEVIVPGHGKIGDRELLKYTQEMFQDDVPSGIMSVPLSKKEERLRKREGKKAEQNR